MSKYTKKTNPSTSIPPEEKQVGGPGGENARGEVAGCPTGLGEADQATLAQQPGGGGAPGTGAANPSVPGSPGEAVTEDQIERSGFDDTQQ
jgi:hypothetical protein